MLLRSLIELLRAESIIGSLPNRELVIFELLTPLIGLSGITLCRVAFG